METARKESELRENGAIRAGIRRILLEKGIKQKDLAARVGMSEQVLSHFLRGRRRRLKPNESRRLAETLGIAEEMLSGGISRLRDSGSDVLLPASRLRLIPVFPIGAGYEIAFGDGDVPAGESLEAPICSDVPDINAFAGKIVGMSMDPGDSLQRGFRENDVVIFDTKAEVRNGSFCLARLEDGRSTFKQIFLDGDEVRLHALNSEVADEVRPRSAVRRLYRAVRHVQRI